MHPNKSIFKSMTRLIIPATASNSKGWPHCVMVVPFYKIFGLMKIWNCLANARRVPQEKNLFAWTVYWWAQNFPILTAFIAERTHPSVIICCIRWRRQTPDLPKCLKIEGHDMALQLQIKVLFPFGRNLSRFGMISPMSTY